jgi:integration host factor subunit alpha
MTLTKAHIIENISLNNGYSKNQSSHLIESVLQIVKKTLASGEDVLLSGFGKFSVKDKREREGRNPTTGKNLTLRARRIVTFRCSSSLKAKMNGEA